MTGVIYLRDHLFLSFTMECGDTVCAKTDPCHEGRVLEVRNGHAIVRFGWGFGKRLALFEVSELNIVQKRRS